MDRKLVGLLGEDAALKYLQARGLGFEMRNWSCRAGELDLVMFQGERIVFVEVKTRLADGDRASRLWAEKRLFANITERKRNKLRVLAKIYLRQRKIRQMKPRIDCVGVVLDRENHSMLSIRHLIAAV